MGEREGHFAQEKAWHWQDINMRFNTAGGVCQQKIEKRTSNVD